ncbi:MAG: hypothetical protein R3323_07470 [Wenzhouxiangellaceae bacterium]|nr:hypothetical protein [Wenzhouxiangellaceae bacterium]
MTRDAERFIELIIVLAVVAVLAGGGITFSGTHGDRGAVPISVSAWQAGVQRLGDPSDRGDAVPTYLPTGIDGVVEAEALSGVTLAQALRPARWVEMLETAARGLEHGPAGRHC